MSKSATLNLGNTPISGNSYVTKIICSVPNEYISDCPNLKTVNIIEGVGDLYIYNCPALVNIDYHDRFLGKIYVFNCPNVAKDNVVRENIILSGLDSLYASQLPFSRLYLKLNRMMHSGKVEPATIDTINHKITYNYLPFHNNLLVPVHLTDSAKRRYDCFVPYSTKELFSQLCEFQPYRSLNETEVLYSWKSRFDSVWGYFGYHSTNLFLSILGIGMILMFFWIVSFTKYLRTGSSPLVSLFMSLFSGIGMGAMALLSFMASYWTVFNIFAPNKQDIATYAGIATLLICILLVYKNSFYSMKIYFKEHGLKGFIRDTQDVFEEAGKKVANGILKKKKKKFIIYLPIGLFIGLVIMQYSQGRSLRAGYITSLHELIENKQFGKALSLIPAIEKTHKSFLYPVFTDSLESIKKQLNKDSLYLVASITPDFINKIALKQGMRINVKGFNNTHMVLSQDGRKYIFEIELSDRDDKTYYQVVLFDLVTQSIDTVTSRNPDSSYHDYYATMLTSKNIVATSNTDGIWLYNIKDKNIKKIADVQPRGIIFMNDSTLLFSGHYDNNLYELKFLTNEPPSLINDSIDAHRLYRIDSNHIAYTDGFGRFCIYDIKTNKEVMHGKKKGIGTIRSVDYKSNVAITKGGVYDIKLDSLIIEREDIYNFKGNPSILQFENRDKNRNIALKNLNNERICKIPLHYQDFGYNKIISEDRYILNLGSLSIAIYRICPKIEEQWPITDADRKLFNLP